MVSKGNNMNEQNNGGPAFPQDYDTAMMANLAPSKGALGMTLRDYFAAKAMQGLMASSKMSDDCTPTDVALDAYDVADAMLRAREAA